MRKSLRSFVLMAIATCGLAGCTLSMGPLERHTAAFASATVLVANSTTNAYRKANQIHSDELLTLAVLNYDRSDSWNPADYVKPLLSTKQLEARTALLKALKLYAEKIADLGSRGKDVALSSASTEAADALQDLSKNVATEFATSVPGALPLGDAERSGLATALVALGDMLKIRIVKRDLPQVLEKNDNNIKAICSFIDADAAVLRRQADKDFGLLETAQDQYIRHATPGLTASERRTEIAKLPQMMREQAANDELLAKLQEAVGTLARTHHALAESARSNNPESVQQYIADLTAEGESLAAYYQSLATAK